MTSLKRFGGVTLYFKSNSDTAKFIGETNMSVDVNYSRHQGSVNVSGFSAASINASASATQASINVDISSIPQSILKSIARAGTRGEVRTPAEIAEIWKSIPVGVRAQGSDAVKQFLSSHDWSHRISHANGGSAKPSNGIWENPSINRSRGSSNMTRKEYAAAQKALSVEGVVAGAKYVGMTAAKGAVVGAAVEGIFAIPENYLAVERGEMTVDEAIAQTGIQVGTAAAVGGAVTGATAAACLMAPAIATALPFVAAPLAVVGIAQIVGRAICLGKKLLSPAPQQKRLAAKPIRELHPQVETVLELDFHRPFINIDLFGVKIVIPSIQARNQISFS